MVIQIGECTRFYCDCVLSTRIPLQLLNWLQVFLGTATGGVCCCRRQTAGRTSCSGSSWPAARSSRRPCALCATDLRRIVWVAEHVKDLAELSFLVAVLFEQHLPVRDERKQCEFFSPNLTANSQPCKGNATLHLIVACTIVCEFWKKNKSIQKMCHALKVETRRECIRDFLL